MQPIPSVRFADVDDFASALRTPGRRVILDRTVRVCKQYRPPLGVMAPYMADVVVVATAIVASLVELPTSADVAAAIANAAHSQAEAIGPTVKTSPMLFATRYLVELRAGQIPRGAETLPGLDRDVVQEKAAELVTALEAAISAAGLTVGDGIYEGGIE